MENQNRTQCAIYGNRLNMDFRFKFIINEEQDYLEQISDELKNHGVEMCHVLRLYIEDEYKPKKAE